LESFINFLFIFLLLLFPLFILLRVVKKTYGIVVHENGNRKDFRAGFNGHEVQEDVEDAPRAKALSCYTGWRTSRPNTYVLLYFYLFHSLFLSLLIPSYSSSRASDE
jgi:hypothetical protein